MSPSPGHYGGRGPADGFLGEAGATPESDEKPPKLSREVTVPSPGGKATAASARLGSVSGTGGRRPRLVTDAIRDDLVDSINQFVSQVQRHPCPAATL